MKTEDIEAIRKNNIDNKEHIFKSAYASITKQLDDDQDFMFECLICKKKHRDYVGVFIPESDNFIKIIGKPHGDKSRVIYYGFCSYHVPVNEPDLVYIEELILKRLKGE